MGEPRRATTPGRRCTPTPLHSSLADQRLLAAQVVARAEALARDVEKAYGTTVLPAPSDLARAQAASAQPSEAGRSDRGTGPRRYPERMGHLEVELKLSVLSKLGRHVEEGAGQGGGSLRSAKAMECVQATANVGTLAGVDEHMRTMISGRR